MSGLNLGPCSLMAANVTTRPHRLLRHAGGYSGTIRTQNPQGVDAMIIKLNCRTHSAQSCKRSSVSLSSGGSRGNPVMVPPIEFDRRVWPSFSEEVAVEN